LLLNWAGFGNDPDEADLSCSKRLVLVFINEFYEKNLKFIKKAWKLKKLNNKHQTET
jgi:hypothetical protein